MRLKCIVCGLSAATLTRILIDLKYAGRVLRLAALLCLTPSVFAADPFAENVRTTEPLSPADELKSFHLPPGFEIQLFASEPDIQKPLNMAFDAKGRLWVTGSREYPYPVPLDKPSRDTIRILEDTDGDGKADKITTFAEGLNIPIGLYPYLDGVIAWSIPNIWFLRDTDGDGKADKKEVLFGPLGWERDTHGMNASFRRGFDGWLYITHGYNNNSTVRGKDGSEIKMNSGNTYRVQLDGSRVEQFVWGQVNPFGLAFDALGNLYSSDCHSAPIYQLLRGGYYPSFGKPHDGLGFAPSLMEHTHNSTAICGISYSEDDRWPEGFRKNAFVGNVMTSRVNRDSFALRGSTKIAQEMPDLVATDDPWFRPVDTQLGPDGAIYVADFYNRIIGHYEVPLNHPGRDRERGRIWRVVYKGIPKQESPRFDASAASVDGLIGYLKDPNLTRRMLAMNQLVDRIGPVAAGPLRNLLSSRKGSAYQKIHALWALHRLRGLDEKLLADASQDSDRGVRTHAMKVLSEAASWTSGQHKMALNALGDGDAFVQRAAADALGRHPSIDNVKPLLALRASVPAADTHLTYGVRVALREQFRQPDVLQGAKQLTLSSVERSSIAETVVAVPSPEAGVYLLDYVQETNERGEKLNQYLRHAARYAPASGAATVARIAREKFPGDLGLQLSLFKSVQDGTAQRGAALIAGAREWGSDLASGLLASAETGGQNWHNDPVEGMANQANPWFLQKRASADGNRTANFLSSLPPGGEQLTGILRSKAFQIPARLTFFIAGHDGFPNQPPKRVNKVQLRSSATGDVLAQTLAPRNDLAQSASWDLAKFQGQSGYVEIVDGDNGPSYAWIAAGRFDPPVAPLPATDPSRTGENQQAAAEIARSLSLKELEPKFRALLASPDAGIDAKGAAAQTLAALNPTTPLAAYAPVVSEPLLPASARHRLSQSLADANPEKAAAVLAELFQTAPYRSQLKLAQSLAGHPAGAERLFELMEVGKAAPRLLLERSVSEKINASLPSSYAERAKKLTAGLSPVNEQVQRAIERKRLEYPKAKTDLETGSRVFAQTCAVCHQIGGQGNVVGPQLDGIGSRGLERILEDVLDPNRNVDRAFRTHLLVLKDGEVISGLPRREEGEILVLADSTGKEISIPKKNIQQRRESESSLMPENFAEVIPREDFDHLLAFLLSKGAGK